MKAKTGSLSYKDAGVDIEKGNLFVREIRQLARGARGSGALGDIGSFSGLFRINTGRYKEPVLVSSTDGVGTKLMIAQEMGLHDNVGFDLVGMCVNDVVTTGAEGLFFLDYIATGRLNPLVLGKVVAGIARACKEAGYSLIGGETAEMPGMYKPGEYDLAGFCVGIAEKRDIIDGSKIKAGDVVLGLESNGLHSNGYSLVRKVFSRAERSRLKADLLRPTRLYAKPVIALRRRINIKGIAHITGGAYIDKIPRIIPSGLGVEIYKGSWALPLIFRMIQERGRIGEAEMYKVFNMGIGMVVVVSPKDVNKAQDIFSKHKLKSWVIGEVVKGKHRVSLL